MRHLCSLIFLVVSTISCQGQTETSTERSVGGPCEDCEAIFDYKILGLSPSNIDTLPGFLNFTPNIKITGKVFHHDGSTPANNILLYVYHTNRNGIYEPSKKPIGWEKRHGQFRGWMKTNEDGKYTFFTFRPAAYPNSREPEHIHLYIKEPGKSEYYVDSYTFTDDPMLTENEKREFDNRGGNGIVTLKIKNGLLTANRDITLGFNIPNYR